MNRVFVPSTRPFRRWPAGQRFVVARPFSIQSRSLAPVELVFEKHEPPSEGSDSKAGADAPKNPAILFLHGLFGSRKNNRTMSKILARDLNRTVYALDLRNHGESPHTSDHTYSAMAEDVEHFIHQHGIETPSLIGHSMGAKVAMAVALRNPSLLESIVSVDNAPVDAALKSDFPAYVRAMRNVDASRVKRQSDADKILQVAIPELPIRQFLLANLVRVTGPESHCGSYLKFRIPLDTLARSLGELGDFPFKVPDDGSAGLGSGVGTSPADTPVRFSKPALFVRGTRSRYVADEMVPITGRFFPLFKLADVEAGHWVISENPEEFRKATVRFYQDLQDD